MKNKIEQLIEEIQKEAHQSALAEIAASMVENDREIWAELSRICGRDKAAIAVICLLQQAVADGAIEAVEFSSNNEDDLTTRKLRTGNCDDEHSFTVDRDRNIWLQLPRSN